MSSDDAWVVVGGGTSGGIVVRAGRLLSSQEHPQKLLTGARVGQVARVGDRLHYKLLEGEGPDEGWVSLKLKDKELLLPCAQQAAAPSSPSPQVRSWPQAPLPPAVSPEQPSGAGADGRQAPKQSDGAGPAPKQVPRQPGSPVAAEGQSPKQSDSADTPEPERRRPKQQESKGAPPAVAQLAVAEALQLQDSLRGGFSAKVFQDQLRKLQRKYPERKQRGHAHGTAYFEAFEVLVMTVFVRVLPKYGLQGNWEGVQDMHARMATAYRNSKVQKQQGELNTLLGLPRDAVFSPIKKAEDMFVYRECRDGGVPGFALPLLVDEDGDEAHEFFVEDQTTGELLVSVLAGSGGRKAAQTRSV